MPKVAGPAVRCAFLPSYQDEAEWVADQIDGAWQELAGPTAARARPRRCSCGPGRRSPPLERALRERGPAGRGGRPGRPARHPRGARRRLHAAGARRPDRRRVAAAAAHRRPLADRPARPRRPAPAGPRDRLGAPRPADGGRPPRRPVRSRSRISAASASTTSRWPRRSTTWASPQLYSAEGWRRLALLRDELRGAARPARPEPARPGRRHRARRSAWTSRSPSAAVRRRGPGWPAPTSTRSATSRPGSPRRPRAARSRAFLAYLAAAEEEERGLTPGEVEVVEGAVQILTAHAAKGLEWDVVAVAGLCQDGVPAAAQGERPLAQGHGRAARSRCAATPTGCPAGAGDGRATPGACATPSRRSTRRGRRTRSGRSGGWPTWR